MEGVGRSRVLDRETFLSFLGGRRSWTSRELWNWWARKRDGSSRVWSFAGDVTGSVGGMARDAIEPG